MDTRQQLAARICRSKYDGKTPPGEWFDVRVMHEFGYSLCVKNNNYRRCDVTFVVGAMTVRSWS